MANKIKLTQNDLEKIYQKTTQNLEKIKKRLNRTSFTLAEKILFGHLDNTETQELSAGKSYLALKPDRIAMQDATAQMALLQFLLTGKTETAIPTTVHCDHLIQAYKGSQQDTDDAKVTNREVYDFLKTVSQKCGIGFWGPGSGIIHQVVLENYAFPGGLMIGTDSHTPNAGGLGMCAVGVGGADAVDAMIDLPWEVKYPNIVGVKLTGKLSGWASPKDVILKLCAILTVKGGTNRIIEYFGEGVESISATGKGTICNMGAELGATCSVFPYDSRMKDYLNATNRSDYSAAADKHQNLLKADDDVIQNPKKYFQEVIEINLSELEPILVGPHTPDLARGLSELKTASKENNYPEKISAALIGSCTNSSYEDLTRVKEIAQDALAQGLHLKTKLLISPGSEQVYETIKRDGIVDVLEKMGATILSNSCGPCIGQWKRDDVKKGESNSIVSSFNRNFPKRNDGNAETLSFIGSPETVIALALAGNLGFNPAKDEIENNGKKIKLATPKPAPDLPAKGFVFSQKLYVEPSDNPASIKIEVSPTSERLQLLEPFKPWNGEDLLNLPILMKAKGKCTTDHISMAGPWLKYRGHLDNISNNLFIGVNNAFTAEVGKHKGVEYPQIARKYKAENKLWVAIGDENYGEGSSREHAAMEPRHLGGIAIICKSFARIHESNLKKQGLLPLTFANPSDYDAILENSTISLTGLKNLTPGKPVEAIIHTPGSADKKITLNHTFSEEQLAWFRAGSALNLIRKN